MAEVILGESQMRDNGTAVQGEVSATVCGPDRPTDPVVPSGTDSGITTSVHKLRVAGNRLGSTPSHCDDRSNAAKDWPVKEKTREKKKKH